MPRCDLALSIFELTEAYPELIRMLQEPGFRGIVNPVTRRTVGKQMTLPAGCKMKRVPLDTVVTRLRSAGYEVTGGEGENE